MSPRNPLPLPSRSFLQLVRQRLASPTTHRVSLARIGFASFSSCYYSQILEHTSLAYDFAAGEAGAWLKTREEYGYALNAELKHLLGCVVREAKSEAGGCGSAVHVLVSELGVRIHVQVEIHTVPRRFRTDKEVLAIYIGLAPMQGREGPREKEPEKAGTTEQMFGCWKWSVTRGPLGVCMFLRGTDLCLDGREKGRRSWRNWLCCGGEEMEDEEELKPLLVEL